MTPGVPAFVAAAAAMKQELTIPEINQSIILTRTSVKSSAMPEGEDLATLGKSGATLVIHLSIRNVAKIRTELTPFYGADCPVVVAYRVGWPDEQILRGTLSDIEAGIEEADLKRTAMIFVGRDLIQRIFGIQRFIMKRTAMLRDQSLRAKRVKAIASSTVATTVLLRLGTGYHYDGNGEIARSLDFGIRYAATRIAADNQTDSAYREKMLFSFIIPGFARTISQSCGSFTCGGSIIRMTK